MEIFTFFIYFLKMWLIFYFFDYYSMDIKKMNNICGVKNEKKKGINNNYFNSSRNDIFSIYADDIIKKE